VEEAVIYNPYDLCEKSENQEPEAEMGTRFEIEPSVMYPATIDRIVDVLAFGKVPLELMDLHAVFGVNPLAAAEQLITRARKVPAWSWQDALAPKDEVGPGPRIADRAEALEIARLWFTQAMQVKEGKVILHILRDERFRL